MMPAARDPVLIDRLPSVRGRLTPDAPLARFSWFRVGGPAEVMFEPADTEDLAAFLAGMPDDVPLTVIGVASNLLVRDGGIPGVTLRLGKAFAEIEARDSRLLCGAGAMDVNVARAARDVKLAGLEFLIGIPGTVGGALRMNAGAYDREIADVFVSAQAVTRVGTVVELSPADMGFAYRHSAPDQDTVFVSATFAGMPGDQAVIAARMEEIQKQRGETQPVKSRTGGSTFANPSDPKAEGARAWELIDRAGCRGLTRGGAQVSPQHCNFLINNGSATAADLEGLGEEVRRRVFEKSGVTLNWEIRRIGVPPKLREVAS